MVKPSVRGSNIMPQPQQSQLMQVGRSLLDILPSALIPFSSSWWKWFFHRFLPKSYCYRRNRNSCRYRHLLTSSVGVPRRPTSYRPTRPTTIPQSELCSVYCSNTIIQRWCAFARQVRVLIFYDTYDLDVFVGPTRLVVTCLWTRTARPVRKAKRTVVRTAAVATARATTRRRTPSLQRPFHRLRKRNRKKSPSGIWKTFWKRAHLTRTTRPGRHNRWELLRLLSSIILIIKSINPQRDVGW